MSSHEWMTPEEARENSAFWRAAHLEALCRYLTVEQRAAVREIVEGDA